MLERRFDLLLEASCPVPKRLARGITECRAERIKGGDDLLDLLQVSQYQSALR